VFKLVAKAGSVQAATASISILHTNNYTLNPAYKLPVRIEVDQNSSPLSLNLSSYFVAPQLCPFTDFTILKGSLYEFLQPKGELL
jgi:hypothetical protein